MKKCFGKDEKFFTQGDIPGPLWIKASEELNDSITIYWGEVELADRYTLYRDGEVYKTNIIGTSFEDTDVITDQIYTYAVQAFSGPCGSDISVSDTGIKPSTGYSFYSTFQINTPGLTKIYVSHEVEYNTGSGPITGGPGLILIDTSTDNSTFISIKSSNQVSQIRFIEDEDTNTFITKVNIIYGKYLTTFEDICYNLQELKTFNYEGPCNVTNFDRAFSNCQKLSNLDGLILSSGESFDYTWYNCLELTNFEFTDFDSATSLLGTWMSCENLSNFPNIQIPNVQSLYYTWMSCKSLRSFPQINTASVIEIESAWRGCTSLTEFPLIDLISCTKLSNAWRRCNSLTEFPLLNTYIVTNFNGAWTECLSLKTFPNLDVSSGITFNYTWYNSGIEEFPDLNFYSAESYIGTWGNCKSLTYAGIVSSANAAQDFRRCFRNSGLLRCIKEINTTTCDWTFYDLPPDDPLYFNPAELMFGGCTSLVKPTEVEIDQITTPQGSHFINSEQCPIDVNFYCEIELFNTTETVFEISDACTMDDNGTVTDLTPGIHTITPTSTNLKLYSSGDMQKIKFSSDNTISNENYKNISISIDNNSLTDAGEMCFSLTNLEQINIRNSGFNTLYNTFYDCTSLTVISISDTSNVTNWENTFRNCSSLITLPEFDMSSGITFNYTFRGCSSLKTLKRLNTISGQYFDYMFQDCLVLQCMLELDTRNKNYSYGIDIPGMFENCNALTAPNSVEQLYLSRGDYDGAWFVNQDNCPSLKPQPPYNLSASSDRWDSVLITWEAPQSITDVDFFRIYHSNEVLIHQTADTNEFEYIDTNVNQNQIYTYYARSVRIIQDQTGQDIEIESDPSNLDNGNILIPEFDRNISITSSNIQEFKFRYNTHISDINELISSDNCLNHVPPDPLDPPSVITDFSASDDLINQIQVTFSLASGNPIPTYDLIRVSDNSVIASDITSGYIWETSEQNVELRVNAINQNGTTPSNTDIGSAAGIPQGSIVFDEPGNYTWEAPEGVSEVNLCMVGGGGSGGNIIGDYAFFGGSAGTEINQTFSLINSTCAVIVGEGGNGTTNSEGNNGTFSGFETLTVDGGLWGRYEGDGAPGPDGCGGGGYNDGNKNDPDMSSGYGGQASSFGNGGNGGDRQGENGGVGAGGGGTEYNSSCTSGAGGRGEVRISWGSNLENTKEEMIKLQDEIYRNSKSFRNFEEYSKISKISPKEIPNSDYFAESITINYDKLPNVGNFCSVSNTEIHFSYTNISETGMSEGDILRTTIPIKIGDELTVIVNDVPQVMIVDTVNFVDPYYEVDTSAVTNGAIPDYTFFTYSNLEIGVTDNIIPNKICDFLATDGKVKQIECHWSEAEALPDCTYNLINADTDEIIQENVTSPVILDYPDITYDFSINLAINAINTIDNTLIQKSNIDTGTALANPPAINDFTATDGNCGSITFNWASEGTPPNPVTDFSAEEQRLLELEKG